MKRTGFMLILILGCLSCAGKVNFYNRDGWSRTLTEQHMANRLLVSENEAVVEKINLELPAGKSLRAKGIVRVLVDTDGHVTSAIIEKPIAGLEKALLKAAQNSRYRKIRDRHNRPISYVVVLEYLFE
ncbi:energy transducer TonB [candidate division KSB1 bacterium]|nr:energy transducer TonB [candidate division KSB1 bacterium]